MSRPISLGHACVIPQAGMHVLIVLYNRHCSMVGQPRVDLFHVGDHAGCPGCIRRHHVLCDIHSCPIRICCMRRQRMALTLVVDAVRNDNFLVWHSVATLQKCMLARDMDSPMSHGDRTGVPIMFTNGAATGE